MNKWLEVKDLENLSENRCIYCNHCNFKATKIWMWVTLETGELKFKAVGLFCKKCKRGELFI